MESQSVQLLWIYSLNSCAEVHKDIRSPTSLSFRTSEQHIEFGSTFFMSDFYGLTRIINWITHHIQFDVNKHGFIL